MSRIPSVYVLAVARKHGTTVAAMWSGRSTATVAELRKRHDGYERGRGRPSVAELEAWRETPDCRCPKHLGVERTNQVLRDLFDQGYGSGTIGRHIGLTAAEVRQRIRDLHGTSIQQWTSLGRSA